MSYIIRSAIKNDPAQLSTVRLQMDGETENLDREKGEGFKKLISADGKYYNTILMGRCRE